MRKALDRVVITLGTVYVEGDNMTVRSTVKTTLTIAVFLLGLRYFMNNYYDLLAQLLPIDEALNRWDMAPYYMGAFYPRLVYFSLVLMLFACLFDGMMNRTVALGLLSSIKIPLFFLISGSLLFFYLGTHMFRLWGIVLLLLLWSIYLTFAKLLKTHLKAVGAYDSSHTSSLKGVRLSIKQLIETEKLRDSTKKGNLIDRIAMYVSLSLVAACVMVALVSVFVFGISYWEDIF